MKVFSSAGTWRGVGDEREKYELLFPKNINGDRFVLEGIQEFTDNNFFPNKITIHIQLKDKETSINDISKIQFALNLINHYKQEVIESAMIDYIKRFLPEKLI